MLSLWFFFLDRGQVNPRLGHYLPFHTGRRFSAKAFKPSTRSSASKATAAIGACCFQPCSSVQLEDWKMISLEAASAVGPLTRSEAASSSAPSSAWPGSVMRLTRPGRERIPRPETRR